ncbi:MAG: hypothetical protein ACOX6L_00420 [Syntrophomonadaceae bacterium]
MPAKDLIPGEKTSWLKPFGITLIIGFMLGLYSGYIALSPMEDDYASVYFDGMSQGESAAKIAGKNNFISLYEQQQLDINSIQNALNKVGQL